MASLSSQLPKLFRPSNLSPFSIFLQSRAISSFVSSKSHKEYGKRTISGDMFGGEIESTGTSHSSCCLIFVTT